MSTVVSENLLTIVTAADARYGRCLWQLLLSAERKHLFQRGHRVVVWDLGLESRQVDRLRHRFPQVRFHVFRYDQYPPYAHPSYRTYAWKPLVSAEAAREYGPRLLWIDSAALLHDDLSSVSAELDRHGMYVLAGQSALKYRGHADILAKMGASSEILDLPEFNAGLIGIDLRHAGARAVVERWTRLPQDPDLWRTVSLTNNPEQALLSVLIRQAMGDGSLTLAFAQIDINCPHPVRWITTRNKVPKWLPEWLDPLVRGWYRIYKLCDQIGLRCRAFHATTLADRGDS